MAKVMLGVVVPMSTLPLGLTVNRLTPVEVLIWNGFRVVVPWTKRETDDELALTPATVPLSMDAPMERAEALVQRAK